MTDIVDFIRQALGARAIEMIAALLGLANVGLLMRRSIWNYPFGLAMVAIYAFVFFGERLYSDAGLQVFFFVVQIYGWMQWAKSRDDDGLVVVKSLTRAAATSYACAAGLIWLALGVSMMKFTNAAFPFWDSSIAALSIVAQVMLARRLIENWFVWIAVDLLAIGLFLVKALYPTAALYLVFLLMSVGGYLGWRSAKPA